MASSSKTTGDKRSLFLFQKPHFMIMILSETMKDEKIAIPPNFLSVHGHDLSESAVFRDSNGEKWQVQLVKVGNHEVLFEKGWEKFTAFYSIDLGDILVFEYDGGYLFNVSMVDKSFTYSGISEENTPLADNAPSFTVRLKETHLPPRSTLNVPRWFARKYLDKNNDGCVILKLKNFSESSWTLAYRTTTSPEDSRVRFKSGWSAFVKDNCLKIDDICSFSLLEDGDTNITFEVAISRS